MKKYIAYTRVSTLKQGRLGASLPEQKFAIEQFAKTNSLSITEWVEETITAAKSNRPKFSKIVKRLKAREADGLIIHKIDRSTRNLADWVILSDLIEAGIDIQVAAESLDLTTRGGRLIADVQAVMAADFIRNQREETKKGMWGRLRQGILPWAAPLGYQNKGKGQMKTVDPAMGPLMRTAFEQYGTGKYSLGSLADKMYELGLRSSAGKFVDKKAFSRMFKNPFYYGVIRVSTTDETFKGNHEPLISKRVFDQVQQVLSGKQNGRPKARSFEFSRIVKCKGCGYSLVGELRRGIIYYRCHSQTCENTSIRDDYLRAQVDGFLSSLVFSETEFAALKFALEKKKKFNIESKNGLEDRQKFELDKLKARQRRLLDMALDEKISSDLFEEKKRNLDKEIVEAEARISNSEHEIGQSIESVEKYLGQLLGLIYKYKKLPEASRRNLVKSLTSDITMWSKNVEIKPLIPWLAPNNPKGVAWGVPHRGTPTPSKLSEGSLDKWADNIVMRLLEYFLGDSTNINYNPDAPNSQSQKYF